MAYLKADLDVCSFCFLCNSLIWTFHCLDLILPEASVQNEANNIVFMCCDDFRDEQSSVRNDF